MHAETPAMAPDHHPAEYRAHFCNVFSQMKVVCIKEIQPSLSAKALPTVDLPHPDTPIIK